MRLRRFVVTISFVLSLAGAGRSDAADDPAVATIRTVYASFEVASKADGGLRERLALIEASMAEAFDFPAMARVAVGPTWKGFTPEQQAALTEAFARYVCATYASRLHHAKGGAFVVKPHSAARGAGRSVETQVSNGDGETSQIDFLVGPGNRVQDVYLNGNVSEIAALRARFGASLKAGGG